MEPAVESLTLTPETVAAAVGRIVADCQPERIVAFGSRARGQARTDSDLDLLVLLPALTADHGSVRRRLHRLLADLPFAKDILVSDPDHFAFWRTRLNSVYHDADEEGITLWDHGRLDPAAAIAVCR